MPSISWSAWLQAALLRFLAGELVISSRVYIRAIVRPLLVDVLGIREMIAGCPRALLTGTPGVGKSTFAVLEVYLTLASGRDVAFWNGQLQVGHVFVGG